MISRKIWRVLVVVFLAPLAVWAVSLTAETLGGVKPGDEWSKDTGRYGKPDFKTDDGYSEEMGCYNWTYRYTARGLEFSVCHSNKDKTGSAYVSFIRVSGKSDAKTGKGIGLGASKAEIEKAYGKSEVDDGGQISYYDFESGVQVAFVMASAKVSEITLVASP